MYYWISMDIRERGRISNWWTGLDSNQRTENRADLQSTLIGPLKPPKLS